MQELLKIFINFFVIYSIIMIVLGCLILFITKRYNDKLRGFYALFLGNNEKDIIIMATILSNFIFTVLFTFLGTKFSMIYIYIYCVLFALFVTFSGNIRTVLLEFVSTPISALIIQIIIIARDYSATVYNGFLVTMLIKIFMTLSILYSLCINLKKVELLLLYRKNRKL